MKGGFWNVFLKIDARVLLAYMTFAHFLQRQFGRSSYWLAGQLAVLHIVLMVTNFFIGKKEEAVTPFIAFWLCLLVGMWIWLADGAHKLDAAWQASPEHLPAMAGADHTEFMKSFRAFVFLLSTGAVLGYIGQGDVLNTAKEIVFVSFWYFRAAPPMPPSLMPEKRSVGRLVPADGAHTR